MREIKFRFFDTLKARIFVTDEMNSYEVWDCIADDRFRVMQYTGVKDKNGVEIYEGDFLTGGVGGSVKPVLVEWGKESRWAGMADGYNVHHIGYNLEEYYFRLSECEVIGNIHENPELLN